MQNKSSTRKNRTTDDESTAYHEAGHAVVSYRFNNCSGDLTITPKKGALGSLLDESDGASETEFIHEIIILYSGFAAECRHDEHADKRGSAQDDEKASTLLQCVNESECNLRLKAKELIDKNWPIIEAIAEKLITHKTLSCDEWQIIIDSFDEGESTKWEENFINMRNLIKERRQ